MSQLAKKIGALWAKGCAPLAVACVILASAPLSAQGGGDAQEIAERVFREGHYAGEIEIRGSSGGGRSFPGGDADEGSERARRTHASLEPTELEDVSPPSEPQEMTQREGMPISFGGAGQALMYIVLAFLVVLIVVAIVMMIRARGVPAEPLPSPHERGKALSKPPTLAIGDPEALAAQGRFDEAILALLLRAIQAAGWALETQHALTPREALEKTRAPHLHAPLQHIVLGAEGTRFGEEEATETLYHALRVHYRALVG